MIKPDIILPVDVSVENPLELHDFLMTLKQYVEDIARKAQQTQMEIRTAAPSTNDIDENEFVRATVGGLHYVYTKKGGTIYRWQLT